MMKKPNTEKHDRLTLSLLTALEEHKGISQRGLAKELGIALGATNAHVKKCTEQGFIQQGKDNHLGYQLTSRGIMEKSKLGGEKMQQSLEMYQELKSSYLKALHAAHHAGYKHICLVGCNVASDIALSCQREVPLPRINGVWDSESDETIWQGLPVFSDVTQIPQNTAFLFTDLDQPFKTSHTLKTQAGAGRLFVPHVLKDMIIQHQETKDSYESNDI